jgi:hypothetical protein
MMLSREAAHPLPPFAREKGQGWKSSKIAIYRA